MNKVYLLIGGNMGDVHAVFNAAITMINAQVGRLLAKSAVYKTAAWGIENQPDFLNQVLLVESSYSAEEILKTVLAIEAELGRIRLIKNGPRVIDIDILFYNDEIIDLPNLKVPHPLLHQRNFTLVPLAEIATNFVHPTLHKTMQELLSECVDKLEVSKVD